MIYRKVQTFKKIAAYLQACRSVRSFNFHGCPLFPKFLSSDPPHNRMAYNIFLNWIRELHLTEVQKVIDVGANHGDFAAAASAMFPSCQILLFEPLVGLHKDLEKRSRIGDRNWRLDRHALGEEVSEVALHVASGRDDIASLAGFSSDYLAHSEVKRIEQVICQVIPLDQHEEVGNWQSIDLIKIDVEGFEFEVLRGARKSLEKTTAVIVEVSLMRAETRDLQRLEKMIAFLVDSGFRILQVQPSWFDQKQSWLPVEFNILARKAT